jgi:hypothetical protein
MLETHGLQLRTVLQELEDNFPPVTPTPNDAHSLIMYRSGQRSVVEWIQQRLENDG